MSLSSLPVLKALFILLLVLASSCRVAFAACSNNVISASPSPSINYDSLNSATQEQDFSLTVQNTSSASCVLSLSLFASPTAVTLKKAASRLNYGISNSENDTVDNILDQVPTTTAQVKPVSFSGNGSQLLRWNFFINGNQVVEAGSYTDSSVEIRAYEHVDGNANNFANSNLLLRDSVTVNAGANVAESCSFPNMPAINTASNVTYSGGSGGTVNLSQAIDTTDASLNDSTLQLSYTDTTCNYAATLSISSQNGGLTQGTGATALAGTFLNRIDYQAGVTFCGKTIQINTAGSTVTDSTTCDAANLNITDLVLRLQTMDNGGEPLLQGGYEDVLTIKIGKPF